MVIPMSVQMGTGSYSKGKIKKMSFWSPLHITKRPVVTNKTIPCCDHGAVFGLLYQFQGMISLHDKMFGTMHVKEIQIFGSLKFRDLHGLDFSTSLCREMSAKVLPQGHGWISSRILQFFFPGKSFHSTSVWLWHSVYMNFSQTPPRLWYQILEFLGIFFMGFKSNHFHCVLFWAIWIRVGSVASSAYVISSFQA